MVDNEKVSSTQLLGDMNQNNFFGDTMFDQSPNAPDLTCPQNDKEWCIEEKESCYNLNEDDYIIVNLMDNVESYTAYEGAPIWSAIYEENCYLSPDQHISKSIFDTKD